MNNIFDPTVAANSNYPHMGPGATKLPAVPAVPPVDPGARTFVYEQPSYIYIVQPEDTLASVARKLFGVNSKHYRDRLRRSGFKTGAFIHVNGALPDGRN